jgi:uncharacterized protein (DUF2141 family)
VKKNHTKTWMHSLLVTAVSLPISLLSSPTSAEESSVIVSVNGLRSQTGNIVVCLWTEQDEGFPVCSSTASFAQSVAATASTATVTFQAPTGDYAISAFHDENQDGELNRGFMGRPEEGIAFSNMNQEQRRGRPSFERAKFTLNGEQTVSLSLMYF